MSPMIGMSSSIRKTTWETDKSFHRKAVTAMSKIYCRLCANRSDGRRHTFGLCLSFLASSPCSATPCSSSSSSSCPKLSVEKTHAPPGTKMRSISSRTSCKSNTYMKTSALVTKSNEAVGFCRMCDSKVPHTTRSYTPLRRACRHMLRDKSTPSKYTHAWRKTAPANPVPHPRSRHFGTLGRCSCSNCASDDDSVHEVGGVPSNDSCSPSSPTTTLLLDSSSLSTTPPKCFLQHSYNTDGTL
mmetsp:Transcript_6487/g.13359  ORF Transcript_6487/g.13359 Transcript_6487/m.13359 type:complete len:242 (+) Transcript_6487:164-889(+)